MSMYLSFITPHFSLSLQVKLEFPAPDTPGDYNLVLYVMCDSYLGCDQEYEFNLTVVPNEEADRND